jgi:predicted AAA+ superfamily ATPase
MLVEFTSVYDGNFTMIRRNIIDAILVALGDTPVVAIHGSRQTGKTTLAKDAIRHGYKAEFATLDDLPVFATAKEDPVGFIHSLGSKAVIDEIQRIPELLLAIKATVDRDRKPGRFLLTGSSHAMTQPAISDSLAGRIENVVLWPLSQGEIAGHRDDFVDALFADDPVKPSARPGGPTYKGIDDLIDRITIGGFPEAVERDSYGRRRLWFESYISTLIQRDVRELADIEGIRDMPRMLASLAGRVGGLFNAANAARDASMTGSTFRRYFALLQAVYLVHTIQPWHTRKLKRLVKSEKVYFLDTGVLANLLDITPDRLKNDRATLGPLLENFVAVELLKQITWSKSKPQLLYLRDYAGLEVDFVLESRGGRRIVAIEVKASATVGPSDFKNMRTVADNVGSQFHRGIVLYTGDQVVPFGENLFALPMPYLWSAYNMAARDA